MAFGKLCASVTKQYNLVPAKGSDALRLGRQLCAPGEK